MEDDDWRKSLNSFQELRRMLDAQLELKSKQSLLDDMRETYQSTAIAQLRESVDFGGLAGFGDPLPEIRDIARSLDEPATNVLIDMLHATESAARRLRDLIEPAERANSLVLGWWESERERLGSWSSTIHQFLEHLRDWPASFRLQLKSLLDRGWCIDPDWDAASLSALTSRLEDGEGGDAEAWLVEYFSESIEQIEANLIQKHPKRASIIADAFSAHRDVRFNLSVPALLIQSEGVVIDRFSRQLFSKRDDRSLRDLADGWAPDSVRAIFVSVFYGENLLISDSSRLPKDFDGLNRHRVLHGEDTTYGTSINSLRAISILNFASYLSMHDEEAGAQS